MRLKALIPFLLNFRLICMIGMILAVIISCAAGPEITWTESKPEPKWIQHIPVEQGFLYFVGSASRTDSLEAGTHVAHHAALSKISGYLGTDIESQFEMTSTEIEQDIGETLKANTEAFVAKAITVDSYHKKMTRNEGNSRLELFDVFVLLKYPEESASEEIARRETEDESTVHAAYRLYQKGDAHEKEGRYRQARQFYHDARNLVGQVRAIVPLGDPNVSDSQELATLLKRREEKAISQLRRVVVWVVEKNLNQGNTSSTMESHLTAVLTKHLFTVLDLTPPRSLDLENVHQLELKDEKTLLRSLKSQGAQFLIVVNGSTSSRSFTMNKYFYEAQGTLRVFDTDTGDTILTLPIQQRGYDRNKKAAGLNALKEAGRAGGELLVNELLQREND